MFMGRTVLKCSGFIVKESTSVSLENETFFYNIGLLIIFHINWTFVLFGNETTTTVFWQVSLFDDATNNMSDSVAHWI